MRGKRIAALALAVSLALAGCGGAPEETASVQSVAMLVGADLTGVNQYNGVTEARATVKVEKDANKTVKECFVEPGDQVREGDRLFSYDTEALELTVTSAELEVEQLRNTITNYETQIAALEKDKAKAASSEQLSYTLQIQEAELNKSETEYNLKQKQAELEKLKESANITEVTAPVSGVVQSVQRDNSSGGDSYGGGSGEDSNAYITLMETGTYRIRGTASEESIRGISEGMEMTAYSRQDGSRYWHGFVESINTGSAQSSGSSDSGNYYDGGSGGESSSKYSFYVALDSSEGLLIGQHVYLRPGPPKAAETGIHLSSGYVVLDGDTASVWAASGRDKLEKRTITLGSYDEQNDEYIISAGLSLQDYIAYPDETLKPGMKVVRYDESSFGSEEGADGIASFSGYDAAGDDGAEDAVVPDYDVGSLSPEDSEVEPDLEVDFSSGVTYAPDDIFGDNGEG